jgi:hypothetical protein
MDKFLILGTNIVEGYANYRGTYRTVPNYVNNQSEDSIVNKHFMWYLNEGDQLGIIKNLEKAKKMVGLYEKLNPPQKFEIVRILEDKEKQKNGEEFLGFDISSNYGYSLLSWNLDIGLKNYQNDEILQKIRPLVNLVREYFKPKLNRYSLFNDIDTAQFCLDCMMSLQKIRPGFWENEEVRFEIIGLSRIIK